MPTVRAYGPRKVETAPLPNQRRDTSEAVPTAETFGAAQGRAMESFGRTLGNVADFGVGIINKIQAQTDETAVIEAHNRLSEINTQLMLDPDTGALNVRGKAALDVPRQVREKFDEAANQIETDLKTPQQRMGFAQARARMWDNTYQQLESHASREQQVWRQEEVAKGVQNAANSAIANAGDLRRMAQERDLGVSLVLTQAKTMGWGPEQTSDAVMKFNTLVHKGVIEKFLSSGADKQAQWYYTEVKDQISGPERADIERVLTAASTQGEGLRASAEIWAKFKPANDNAPIELDKMEEAARAMFGDDAKGYDATMKYLREKASVVSAAQKDRAESLVGGLWQAVAQGATLSQITHTDAYRQAPGRIQSQLADYIVGRAEHAANVAAARESQAAARESRAYTRERRAEEQRDRAGTFQYYQLLDNVHQMTDAQIWAKVPEIGEGNATRLLEARRKVTANPAALDDFRSDTSVINGVLEQAHIDPNPVRSDKQYNDKIAGLGWFREEVAKEQRVAQGVTKTKLTNDELEAIAKRVLGQQVMKQGYFLGFIPWGEEPMPLVSATFSDIPQVEVDALKARFAAKGHPNPTNDQILNAWRIAVQDRKK